MTGNCIKIFMLFFFWNCYGQTSHETGNGKLDKAKWYFYSYASALTGYLRSNETINPLKCEATLNSVNTINKDTLKVYFDLYYKDTLNICSFKPYDLIGVMIIRDTLYLPIYHAAVFDSFNDDSTALQYMKEYEMILKRKIDADGSNINPWLRQKAKPG